MTPAHSWPTPRFAQLLLTLCFTLLGLGSAHAQGTNPRQDLEPDGRSRTFNLFLVNQTDRAQIFTVSSDGWSCCDSPLPQETYGPIPPGGRVTVWIARVQGNDCDGEQGKFWLLPAGYGGHERQEFSFTNDGYIALVNTPNRYAGTLSRKNPADGSYTYTLTPLAQTPRLASPVDERLTQPRAYIAADTGNWTRATAVEQRLIYDFEPGIWQTHFEDCELIFDKPVLWHPQHVLRLPNKDGIAYFVFAGSRGYNGYITFLRSKPGVLDPQTDLLRPNGNQPILTAFKQWVYTGDFNGTFSGIGEWNHPGKLSLAGGVLLVAAQNWSETKLMGVCTRNLSNHYLHGDSEEAVLFYDVRDPGAPNYWGRMTATELDLPVVTKRNGPSHFNGRVQISSLSLVRTPAESGEETWILTAGGGADGHELNGNKLTEDQQFRIWKTTRLSPNIEDWQPVAKYSRLDTQHGISFNNYQRKNPAPAAILAANPELALGRERINVFGAEDYKVKPPLGDAFVIGLQFQFSHFVYKPADDTFPGAWSWKSGQDLPLPPPIVFTEQDLNIARNRTLVLDRGDAGKHYDAESMYITRKGMPVGYTVASGYGDYKLLQTHDTVNLTDPVFQAQPVANKVVTNTKDSGYGSLRQAIGYGGKITFAPALSGQTINLTGGPLIAYLYDVDIDASALPGALTLSGGGLSSVFQVESGVKATLRGVTIRDGGNASDSRFSDVVVNRGTLELFNSTLHDNRGGLRSFAGSVLLQNCTVTKTGLSAVWNAAGSTMRLRHCTVAGNVMAGGSSAVVNLGTLTLENSIVANNQNAVGAANVAGAYATVGANLIGGDARLAPLALNGARIATMEPLPDSPAINAGLASMVATDALGRPRPIGGAPDLGAVEAVVVTAVSSSNLDYFSLSGESLSWGAVPGAEFEVFLNPGNGFVSVGRTTGTSLALPELIANRNYQWRIDVTLGGRTYPGRTQAFTTRGPLVVTTLADENDSGLRQGTGDSLRELLKEASPGELIRFAPSLSGRSIWLDRGPLLINQSVTIDAAPLPDRISIDALGKSRVFTVSAGKTVVLKGLRIANGFAATGAGIFNDGGTLTLLDCRLSENESSGNGGGVHNANGGSLTVAEGTVFERNFAQDGGGLFNAAGCALEINGATFSRNEALGGGGAINNRGTPFIVEVAGFFANGAATGGAIYQDGGIGLVENCTLARNSSAAGTGGGLVSRGGSALTVRHCTIAENVGAGVANEGTNPVALDNSIVSGNFDLKNGASDFLGSYAAVGANLVRVAAGSTLASGPAPLTSDPLLGSLSSGVMPLLVGSPAINGGVATANTPSIDQERSLRPFGPAPDLGALESRLSAVVDLLWLTTSAGPLKPAFERSTTHYTATVGPSVTTVAVRPAAGQSGQTLAVRINGGAFATVGSKEASPDLALSPGENTVEVRVTAADGSTTRTYALVVVRGAPAADNAGLALLATSGGALSPAFDFATTDYHVTVPDGTAAITVTATAARPDARLELRPPTGGVVSLISGAASPSVPLDVGANPLEIRVLGEADAVAARYTLTVTRRAPAPADASLAALAIGAGALQPAFAPGIAFYHLVVPAGVASTTVTPTAAQAGAAVQVRVNSGAFTSVASGAASTPLALATGENVIEAKVTATDGTTVRSYLVVVTRRDERLEWASSPGNANSSAPAVSADGRFVAYSSAASNLVPGDSNNTTDIFVYDRMSATVERVSVSNAGVQGNFASVNPSLSADGRFVAFESEATNLVPNDSNGQSDRSQGVDVFVFDRTTRTIERVSLTETGNQVNQASRNPSISGDGRFVAFSSGGNNLIAGFRNGEVNVYVRDRVAGTLVGVSVPFSVTPSNRASLNPVISEDGNFVAFEFTASLNDGNRSFSYRDVYLFNRVTRAVERLTGTKVGREADRTDSRLPAISGDGRYVAFQSTAEDLDFHDVNGRMDVFVYDRIAGTTRRVSASPTGVDELFQDSVNASISGDGRYVTFQSRIANFVATDTNESIDIFVRDLVTGELMLKSSTPTGEQGNSDSTFPTLSGDGRVTAFLSQATNLGADDPEFRSHVLVAVTTPPAASAVADLASLTTSLGALSPGFSPAVTAYTQQAPATAETVAVRPVAARPGTTLALQVNGGGFVPIVSGEPTPALPLVVGANTVEVRTTAANGTAGRLYVVTVQRARSGDASLDDLTLAAADGPLLLAPAFVPATTDYAASVPNLADSLTVRPVAAHPRATVRVNGTAVTGETAGINIALQVGANAITTEVTAEDGTTRSSYTVTVTRSPSSNADLARLLPNVEPVSGILPFSPDRTDYAMVVDHATAAVAFTPTAAHPAAKIAINGQPVASGAVSSALSLNVGANPVTFTVTAEDGITTNTYAVAVLRASSSNANLANLVSNGGALAPSFAGETTAYTVQVPNVLGVIAFTPTVAEAGAEVSINGVPVDSGAVSGGIGLNVGGNAVTIQVKAPDGVTTKVYLVTVIRAPNADANLALLLPSVGTLTPVFTSGTVAYTVNVPNTQDVIAFTPTVVDGAATVKINDVTVVSGAVSGPINLTVGSNLISILVTAQDGTTTRTYAVTVNRAAAANADLAFLLPSAGTLTPVFARGTVEYTANVPNETASMTITPVVADGNATVKVNGVPVVSGAASGPISLEVGSNAILTVVTAPDGVTTKTYTLILTRAGATNAELAGLLPSTGTLQPAFAGGTVAYSVTVPNTQDVIAFTPTVLDGAATVKINDVTVVSGAVSGPINLTVGSNLISILVTAQDGTTTRTYAVTVHRAAAANADLAFLLPSAGMLTPVFARETVEYTANVPSQTSSLTITPVVVDGNATVKVNGVPVSSATASGPISLEVGSNVILTVVTAPDGITTKTYTLTLNRAGATNAELAGLLPSTGTLTPAFAGGTAAYTVTVPNTQDVIAFTPTVVDGAATVKINDVTVVSGAVSGPINLTVGSNLISILVTAQDGTTTRTYAVTVNRAAAANADLAFLLPSAGMLTPVFARETVEYTAKVPNATSSLTITPVVVDGNATVKVNGVPVSSATASGPISLEVGSNAILTVVTAPDGVTTKTYTLTLTRAGATNAELAGLLPSTGTLTPAFASGTVAYTVNVPNTQDVIAFTPTVVDGAATVKINDVTVVSGAVSGPINLTVGSNLISILVTAQDGTTTRTYAVTVHRASAANTDLAFLLPSAGMLTPVFARGTVEYTAKVPNETASMTITPVVADGNATVKVNGVTVVSGAVSGPVHLTVGSNTIVVAVTAADGLVTKTYTVTVTRAPGVTRATLSAKLTAAGEIELTVDGDLTGTLRVEFSEDLEQWRVLELAPILQLPAVVHDVVRSTSNQRYYRVVLGP